MNKINFKELLQSIWFIKPFVKRTICKACKKNKIDKEYYPYCWDCYYKRLKDKTS